MTSGCHWLYLDTYVSNSARQTGTVRLDPRAILDRLAISYDRDGRAARSSDGACLLHQ
jgi:hypothetical protein